MLSMPEGGGEETDRIAASRELNEGIRAENSFEPRPSDTKLGVPREIIDLFVTGLKDWLEPGDQRPTIKYMRCRTFWPRLFCLFLSQPTAAKLARDMRFQRKLVDLVNKMSCLLDDQHEVGLICFADVPPNGRHPNRPIMALAFEMKPWRQITLGDRLTEQSGISFEFSNIHNDLTDIGDNIGVALGNPIFIYQPADASLKPAPIMSRHRRATNVAGVIAFGGLLTCALGFVAYFADGGPVSLIVSAVAAMTTWAAAEFGQDKLEFERN